MEVRLFICRKSELEMMIGVQISGVSDQVYIERHDIISRSVLPC